ncbi:MAG TPA: peptidoglycan-binding domain-containing protein [Gaiellaceae bacterium]|jgi:hypothetical protein|nr:peptidoglycan-binding domain-containing protein [Gaiellaceae bacterium]
MEGREERDPGYDDWFDEPEPPHRRGTRGVFEDEDAWVLPEPGGKRRARPRSREPIVIAGRELGTTQLAVIGVSLVAILIALLAAFGAFSSGGGKTSSPPATVNTTPPTVSPSVTTPTVSTAAAQAPTTTLQPGDTGAQVKSLQETLTVLGFSPGKADGDYGPATQVAVEHFQASKGLGVDGVVGPQTLSALQKALSG